MIAIREKKKVQDGKVVIHIPESFGEEVDVIVLAEGNGSEIEFWTDEEIANLGKVSVLRSDDLDDEDYSKW